ncbi:MAG: 23S rRNA (uracil(1939)-C(5))-methyltransferase RlmD, partial [Firmicutes bacterium]|nr:23S rRNA (uracil(1939)-C(5))-methyltransferase RlmD [Bacillota bacterium]
MEKGKRIELYIEDMSTDGNGIGRADGQVVFVEGCVKGDKVEAEITKVKKNYALADCLKVIEQSPLRNVGFCPYSRECGGCPLGDLEYEAQLKIKEDWVREKLTRLGGIDDPVVRPIMGMDEPFRYRNKAEFKVGPGGEVGFFARKSHRVIDCPDCLIQREEVMGVARGLREYLADFGNPCGIRGMTVKMSFGTGEMMAVIEAKSENVPHLEELCAYMDEGSGYNLESIFINEELVAGKSIIRDEAEGLKFEISRDSFYQVNPAQTVKLYDKAVEYAAVEEGQTVLDLYCGVGTIGLFAAKTIGNDGLILGIET